MDNPETLAAFGTQDTRRRQAKQKTHTPKTRGVGTQVGAALNFVYRRSMCDFRQIRFNHCRRKLKVKI